MTHGACAVAGSQAHEAETFLADDGFGREANLALQDRDGGVLVRPSATLSSAGRRSSRTPPTPVST